MLVHRATIVGAGIMGHGIAVVLAQGGCQVTMVDVSDEVLETSGVKIRAALATLVRHKLLDQRQAERVQSRIHGTTDLEAATHDSDFVVEAATEDIHVKRSIFSRLDSLCPSRTILTSNTSSLPIAQMASATQRPDRVLGTHFIMPAHVMPLVEIVRGEKTSDDTVQTTLRLMKESGKTPVVVNKDIPGFIHNRLQAALGREACALIQAGVASPQDIDTVVTRGFGLRYSTTGPMEQRDLAGLNIHYAVAKHLYPLLDTSTGPHQHYVQLVTEGHLGVKTGQGFYNWEGKDAEAILRDQEERLIEVVKNASRYWESHPKDPKGSEQ
jgi:3-hydroxyacyl-CoA dehydrogenase